MDYWGGGGGGGGGERDPFFLLNPSIIFSCLHKYALLTIFISINLSEDRNFILTIDGPFKKKHIHLHDQTTPTWLLIMVIELQ